MKLTNRHTLYASYLGYITQAIIINLPPLLFVTFQREFSIPLEKISALTVIIFVVQIFVDFISSKFVDKIGYRKPVVFAHACAVLGLLLMGTLPYLIDPYTGIVIATLINAVGGGLTEVLISPIVESLPGDEKVAAISILHSFYCFGYMAVVLFSTLYFALCGTENWRFLPFLWAIIPFFNMFFFAKVPLYVLVEEEERVPLRTLCKEKVFLVLFALMVCAGASEQAMGQWSSLFAEEGLGVSKTLGDLLGPCTFAALMGLARAIFGKIGEKLHLRSALSASAILCICAYLLTVFAPHPLLSLVGCGICGFSVGIMWPGVLSLAARTYSAGGAAMFAILALAGDLGCAVGPGVVGMVSSAAEEGGVLSALTSLLPHTGSVTSMKAGMLIAMVFPFLLFVGIRVLKKQKNG